jgi:hypothetical protein
MRLFVVFLTFLLPLSLSVPARAGSCTTKIQSGTDPSIWGGDPFPYSESIVFGAQVTFRVMDGFELVTIGGTPIPVKYLYDISPSCNSLREWDGDRYYYTKWYR